MIASVISKLTGLEASFRLEVSVLVFCMAVFGTSVYLGLDKSTGVVAELDLFRKIEVGITRIVSPTIHSYRGEIATLLGCRASADDYQFALLFGGAP